MSLDATTRGGELGARGWGLGTRENLPAPSLQPPAPMLDARATSIDCNIRNILGCELAAEVIRSSGKLRLRATGASMLPAIWPGDVLSVSSHNATEAQPGDIVLFKRNGGLVVHRVVEVRRQETGGEIQESGFRSQEAGVPIQDSKFKIPNSEARFSNPESRVPSPESRTEFITRGDSVAGNDAPISCDELLGRVTSIERGSRQFTPHQSTLSRMASWIFSRSDFATKVVLKSRGWAQAIQDSKFKIRESRIGTQDLA